MDYVEAGMTREQREQLQVDIIELRPYILALKEKELGGLRCEMCLKEAKDYDIHHTTYSVKVRYQDLQLLCIPCHKSITDFRRMANRAVEK